MSNLMELQQSKLPWSVVSSEHTCDGSPAGISDVDSGPYGGGDGKPRKDPELLGVEPVVSDLGTQVDGRVYRVVVTHLQNWDIRNILNLKLFNIATKYNGEVLYKNRGPGRSRLSQWK